MPGFSSKKKKTVKKEIVDRFMSPREAAILCKEMALPERLTKWIVIFFKMVRENYHLYQIGSNGRVRASLDIDREEIREEMIYNMDIPYKRFITLWKNQDKFPEINRTWNAFFEG